MSGKHDNDSSIPEGDNDGFLEEKGEQAPWLVANNNCVGGVGGGSGLVGASTAFPTNIFVPQAVGALFEEKLVCERKSMHGEPPDKRDDNVAIGRRIFENIPGTKVKSIAVRNSGKFKGSRLALTQNAN